MLVVLSVVVGHAGLASVHIGAAQLFCRDFDARRSLHQRRPAKEDRARAFDDHRLVAHGRHVCAAGGATAHHRRDLRDACRAHRRLVVENAAEVIGVGEDLILHRQKRAARVHQIHARQPVLQRDLLRAQVLLDRDGVVCAALYCGIVGDDHALASGDRADAGDDAGRRRFAVVHLPRGQRREFEERRVGVNQTINAVADEELALLGVAPPGLCVAALPHLRQACAQFGGQRAMVLGVPLERIRVRINLRFDDVHRGSPPMGIQYCIAAGGAGLY